MHREGIGWKRRWSRDAWRVKETSLNRYAEDGFLELKAKKKLLTKMAVDVGESHESEQRRESSEVLAERSVREELKKAR